MEQTTDEVAVRRMNWGCGSNIEKGWINVDRRDNLRGLDINCDIRDGLPLEDDSIDYIASMMALQEVPYDSLVPVLSELRRVLKPDGVLRLGLPDLERLVAAYQGGDRDFFLIPDEDMKSLGGKFILMTIWYGYTRTLFVWEFAEEMILRAGFSAVRRSSYRQTESPYPGIVELDNREPETLFVEAVK
jgi:SAM-dependent methyltransferase